MSAEFRRVFSAIALLIIINLLSTCDSECILSLNKDFNSIGPVFIRNGQFLETNTKQGDVTFNRSDTVLISCPKRKIVLANQTSSYETLEAHCIINSTFRVDRQILSFKDIRCNSHPWFTTQEKRETCYNGRTQMYQVGYQVRSKFYPIYEACFDKNSVRTHFVQHRITPNSVFRQNGLKRPQFTEGTLFGKIRMNEVYKMNSQVQALDSILGPKLGDHYLSKTQFLSRGHLAANADYATSALIRATFHYVNTAPQWMRGNAGDWAALEEALRRRVHELGTPVIVYTGNHGMMALPDKGGRMREIFLHADLNNNFNVPVPMYFYKLVYDPSQKRASVFLTINSSFYNDSMTNSLVFCDNICDKDDYYNNFKWLRWRSNDGTFSFCCDYDQFVREVDYLPKLDVRGRFY
uniref:DNA/RNA non-specific endonuclease n=1 Tax=Spodoptera litura TaxID=69820 RepID=A0A7D3SNL3_SPOLT|nr:DNA/RNA non-specific endonuclease [Spodoptera litura]